MFIYTTLTSDNPAWFLLETIQKLIMTTDDKIRDEKLQCNINRQTAKISVLQSRQIDKYEYLTHEEIILFY